MRGNGSDTVTIRTRHGTFSFRRLRFVDEEKKPISLFPELISPALHRRAVDWASEAVKLLTQCGGSALLSEDGILRLCQAEATRRDDEQGQAIQALQKQSEEVKTIASGDCSELPSPCFVAVADIYEGQEKEFVALTDAICVSSQKPTRQKKGQEREEKTAKRHDTDVFVLPRRDDGEQFFCEGISEKWSCVSYVSAFLRQEWSGKRLPVVAITDGAKKIRSDLFALFGEGVRVILDWYHLAKRVTENLSMAAHSMTEREGWEKQILSFLWAGEVSKAVEFLSAVKARGEKAKTDLLGYLQKHEAEIIDYGRRQKAGKPIGSGRMEKAVDQVIGLRQKNRGMSWTKAGSRALDLLTIAKLDARIPASA